MFEHLSWKLLSMIWPVTVPGGARADVPLAKCRGATVTGGPAGTTITTLLVRQNQAIATSAICPLVCWRHGTWKYSFPFICFDILMLVVA